MTWFRVFVTVKRAGMESWSISSLNMVICVWYWPHVINYSREICSEPILNSSETLISLIIMIIKNDLKMDSRKLKTHTFALKTLWGLSVLWLEPVNFLLLKWELEVLATNLPQIITIIYYSSLSHEIKFTNPWWHKFHNFSNS
jgi:hypothetical protein